MSKATEREHDQTTAPLADVGGTEVVLGYLFECIPKLEELVYYGEVPTGPVCILGTPSAGPSQLPPLHRLAIGQVRVAATELKQAFFAFKETLTELTLESINLEDGTWKDVLNIMMTLDLELVCLSHLSLRNSIALLFSNVHAQRPLVVGPEEAESHEEEIAFWGEHHGDVRAEDRELFEGILRELDNDFIWVFYNMVDVQEIKLGIDEEPEEVRWWLAVVRDQHLLV